MEKLYVPEADSFSRKLVAFYFLLLIEIWVDSFTYYIEIQEPDDSGDGDDYDYGLNLIMFFVLIGLQGAIQVLMMCWVFFLVW